MRLIQSSIGTIWEHETSARNPLKIHLAFDCKEPLSIASIEAEAKLIRERKADCALIIHTGFKGEDAEEGIRDQENRIGKIGIIRTVPLIRRELDLLMMINRVKNDMSRRDREKLDVEKLDKEVAGVWSKLRGEIKRLVENLNTRGYLLPKYDLHEHDDLVLISLFLTSGYERKAYEDWIKFLFSAEFEDARGPTLPIPYITHVKERVKERGLVNQEWNVVVPTFLQGILEDLGEGERNVVDLLRRFILGDETDLLNWLGYLVTLSVVRQSDEHWILTSDDELKKEIEKAEINDPEDIDLKNEYEGTLRNFLAQFQYGSLKKKLEAIKSTFMQNITAYKSQPANQLNFIRNIAIHHAVYMKGYKRFFAVIEQARLNMETSKSELTLAKGDIKKVESSIDELNKDVDTLISWEVS